MQKSKRYLVLDTNGKETDSTDRLKLAILAAECNCITGSSVLDTFTGDIVYDIPTLNPNK